MSWSLKGDGGRAVKRTDDEDTSSTYHTREEICDTGTRHNTRQEQHQQPHSAVGQRKGEPVEKAVVYAIAGLIVHASIFLQAVCGEFALLLTQPHGRAWKVGQDEVGRKGNDDGDGAFDDESVLILASTTPVSL